MKPSPCLAALALALCLGCTLVAANDLQMVFTVLDCYGQPVAGAVVGISGCVDDFNMGGIRATTDQNGMAELLVGQMNSIQYCYGSAGSLCSFQVLSTPGNLQYTAQTLLVNNVPVTPKSFICTERGCCTNCGTCPSPLTGPMTTFRPIDSTCTVTPPVDVAGETCFGWFKPTYNGMQDLTKVPVVSTSFRSDQKNAVDQVLSSGSYSLSTTPTAPFAFLGNSQDNVRWGWEQLWNLPTMGAMTQTGSMYCGQNKFGGNIQVIVTATSLTYKIVMGPGTKFKIDDVHVYASCDPLKGNNFVPGKLNCNPSKPSECFTTGQLTAGGSQYEGSITFKACPSGQLFTSFHLGLGA